MGRGDGLIKNVETRQLARWINFLPLLSAPLLWLSHFPVAWGWLGWIALVPLLLLIRLPMAGWRQYLIAWVVGLGFFVPAIQWMRVADDMMFYSWLALSLFCSWFFPLGIALLRRLDRRLGWPLAVTVPIVWAALELLRGRIAGGFPWYLLAHTQQAFLPIIQIADWGGVEAVTILVAAVNGLVADAVMNRLIAGGHPQRRVAIVVGSLFMAALIYGGWRLGQSSFTEGPRIALLQGNVPQGVRNAGTDDAAAQMISHFIELHVEAGKQTPKPDLVVWPETSFPGEWCEPNPSISLSELTELERTYIDVGRRDTAHASRLVGTRVLLGLNSTIFDGNQKYRRFNSGILIEKYGTVVGRYDKIHRVPFGEFIPFEESLPWLKTFAPYGEDVEYGIQAGESFTRFEVPSADRAYTFGVLICYEDSDAVLARQYLADPKVDFLVNISNDGWFKCTAEHEEHLAVSRFRAIECRRSLCRAVNMGVSAIIDGNGRIVQQIPKGVAGVLAANVPIDSRTSLYPIVGDWLPWGCWGILIVGCFWPAAKRPS